MKKTDHPLQNGSRGILLLSVFALLTLSIPMSWASHAQLSLGIASDLTVLDSCPPGATFTHPLTGATCYSVTISNCSYDGSGSPPYLPELVAYVAVSKPSGWSSTNGSTVFLHDGGDGTDYFNVPNDPLHPERVSYAYDYFHNHNLQVVQIAWASDWHDNFALPAIPTKSVKFEACRPATLLHKVYTAVQGGNSNTGAMCAQGHSAGSAAVAFAMEWYNAKSYLDTVVLTSGPVYSDIRAGCQNPAVPPYDSPIRICDPPQYKCFTGGLGGWPNSVQYLGMGTGNPNSAAAKVAGYTNSSTHTPPGPGDCNGWQIPPPPTTAFDDEWYAMSLIPGADFSYPQVRLYGFLCASGGRINNSAGQGELFYKNITSANQTKDYALYRVDNCSSQEDIWNGVTYPVGQQLDPTVDAYTVSSQAMINNCKAPTR